MRLFLVLIFFSTAFWIILMSAASKADDLLADNCKEVLEQDMAYSMRTVQEDEDEGPRFAVPGGPVDLLMTKTLSGLDADLVGRLKAGFIVELITHCRNNPDHSMAEAIDHAQKKLRLDTASRNWGIKAIDTEKLLSGTCEAFVLHVQEHGVGEMFYNNPVLVTFDAYWMRFDLDNVASAKTSSVESDAQFACSLEPERKFIDVLDDIAAGYKLQRVR